MTNKNLIPFERNRYFYGKMLTAQDFEAEQKYFNDKRRLVNRSIHGAGVVCGLGVNAGDDTSLTVESGLALDYMGREIVVGSPVFQKLAMLQGADKLENTETAYLCLAYKEVGTEAISNIGGNSNTDEYNKIEEGFSLYLDTNRPDYATLYSDGGMNRVALVYSEQNIDIVQIMPSTVAAGEIFSIKYVIVKDMSLPALSFTVEFSSDYIRGLGGEEDLQFSYRENAEAKKHVTVAEFRVRAAQMPGVRAPYSREKPSILIEYGDYSGVSELHQVADIVICKDKEELRQIEQFKLSTLGSRLYGGDTPIYLAKIDYASAGGIYMLRSITPHPFSQRIESFDGTAPVQYVSSAEGATAAKLPEIKTEVETLKYWQKPEVSSEMADGSLTFRFGIPSSEAYDYATSSGVAEIPMTGSIRVGARFVSDEIQHLLGLGNVSITLSVAFGPGDDQSLLFGNGEVFKSKDTNKDVPKVQTAAIVYPSKGTFKIGVWCTDHVEGSSLRVHWFAMKTTRDTAEIRTADKVSVKVVPEIHKTKVRKTVHFKASVSGSSDKEVIWALAEENSGSIDQNGTYKAPSTPGTYEVIARSGADENVRTSAFVIVED